jgi:hypothetical protein
MNGSNVTHIKLLFWSETDTLQLQIVEGLESAGSYKKVAAAGL